MSVTVSKKQRTLVIGLIALGVLFAAFFGMRAFHAFKHMRGAGPFGKPPPAERIDVTLIRDWMTVPYVANMYHIPPEALFKLLDIPGQENSKKSLKELNDIYYPGQDGAVLAYIQAAIQAMQKQAPPPRFPATPIPITPTP